MLWLGNLHECQWGTENRHGNRLALFVPLALPQVRVNNGAEVVTIVPLTGARLTAYAGNGLADGIL